MMIVRFYEWPEFLATLKASPPGDATVRLVLTVRNDQNDAQHLMMLAGYRGRAAPTEFIQCLGIKPTDPNSARAAELMRLVGGRKQILEHLGFVVKSRRYVSSSANGGETAE